VLSSNSIACDDLRTSSECPLWFMRCKCGTVKPRLTR
jgi:hypothetical protein